MRRYSLLAIFLLGLFATACRPTEKLVPEIVSTREVNRDGRIIVEATLDDESQMYFEILSGTTACVCSAMVFYDEISHDSPYYGSYSGTVVVPESFVHYGQSYTVTRVDNGAFEGCCDLIEVVLPNTIEDIGSSAFATCTALKAINLPEGIQYIGISTFLSCHSLKTIRIPDSVEGIYLSAFYDCIGLESIELGKQLKGCGALPFAGCTSLTTVICHSPTPPALFDETDSFLDDPIQEIRVPAASVDAYREAVGWNRYADQIVGY